MNLCGICGRFFFLHGVEKILLPFTKCYFAWDPNEWDFRWNFISFLGFIFKFLNIIPPSTDFEYFFPSLNVNELNGHTNDFNAIWIIYEYNKNNSDIRSYFHFISLRIWCKLRNILRTYIILNNEHG